MNRVDEIEHKICCNELSTSQVFTQMKQLIEQAMQEQREEFIGLINGLRTYEYDYGELIDKAVLVSTLNAGKEDK